jgi:histidinol dehydrogenase
VIADETAPVRYIAADLLAQAEHSEDASSILITTDQRLAAQVAEEVEVQLALLPRRGIASASLANYGAIFIVDDLYEACELANAFAPEHLEIMARNEDELLGRIKHAGAVFLGEHTPEAVGDYFAGPNHVLPTGGAVRFSSALGVYDFVRRTSILRYSREELQKTAPMIAILAAAEGLDAHARSAMIRAEEQVQSA